MRYPSSNPESRLVETRLAIRQSAHEGSDSYLEAALGQPLLSSL
jgi:hypothetical protein